MDGFSCGGGGGEEETPGHVLLSRFRRRTTFSNNPIFYVIYYILISGVSLLHASDHRERCPRSSMPCANTCSVEVSTKDHYQAFFWVLIDLIVELLGLIIKPFDNQTES